VVAVLTIYVLDFAINVGELLVVVVVVVGVCSEGELMKRIVQWSSRSLIVDSLPTSKQQLGSAWGEW